MDKNVTEELSSLVKQQLLLLPKELAKEHLINCHYKITTMLDVLLVNGIDNYSQGELYEYLCIVSDFADQAKLLHENLVSSHAYDEEGKADV